MSQVQNIVPGPPQPLANFDAEDIITGLGTVDFFGIASTAVSTVNYHLISNASVWSQPVGTNRTSVGTTTIDFDTSAFNLSRTAKGTASFSAGIGSTAGSDSTKLSVTLLHVDSGASETAITSEITSQTTTDTSDMVFLELPITEKHFKRGEVLRLRVKLVKVDGSTSSEVGHDPANQSFGNIIPGTADTTVMRLIMPFRVEA